MNTMLSAAKRFRDYETDNLRNARGAAFWTWVSYLPLLLAGLGGLAWIQWSLARRTHRFLNYGLLGATVLMVATLGVTVWSLWNWPESGRGLKFIEEELAAQRDLIDTERKMLNASADINLLLGGASSLTLDEFKNKFKENINCTNQESLCDAYDNFIYNPLDVGKSIKAMAAALPGGEFAKKFDVANQTNVTKIKTRAKLIQWEAKEVPPVSSQVGLPIALLCSCAAVCAGLGFWVRIKEYL